LAGVWRDTEKKVAVPDLVKESEGLAAMVTGIGDGTIPDEFEPGDVVGVDLD